MPNRIRTRKKLSQRFNRIRNLRNRVFHHEPIWYWQDLAQQHEDILEAIAWIEPAMRDLACAIDRFPGVHQKGLQEIEQKLKRFCRCRRWLSFFNPTYRAINKHSRGHTKRTHPIGLFRIFVKALLGMFNIFLGKLISFLVRFPYFYIFRNC